MSVVLNKDSLVILKAKIEVANRQLQSLFEIKEGVPMPKNFREAILDYTYYGVVVEIGKLIRTRPYLTEGEFIRTVSYCAYKSCKNFQQNENIIAGIYPLFFKALFDDITEQQTDLSSNPS